MAAALARRRIKAWQAAETTTIAVARDRLLGRSARGEIGGARCAPARDVGARTLELQEPQIIADRKQVGFDISAAFEGEVGEGQAAGMAIGSLRLRIGHHLRRFFAAYGLFPAPIWLVILLSSRASLPFTFFVSL